MNVEPASAKAPGWVAASLSGAVVFVVMLGLGELLAIIDRVSLHLKLGAAETLKLGTVFLSAFHRGTVVVSLSLFSEISDFTVSAALMLGTLLALWLLFRAGATAAGGGNLLSRGSNGARVAPAYALLSLGSVALFSGGGLSQVKVLLLPALLCPLILAAVAGFAGGVMTARDTLAEGQRRRILGVLAGAWGMLAYGLVAAFVALMLLAALKPEYSRVYLAGFRAVRQHGGAAALANNAMLLPNEAVWAMNASMGACDGVYGSVDVDALCYSHFPTGLSEPSVPGPTTLPAVTTVPRIPKVLLIFALVPPAAVLLGGAAGERFTRARSYREAALIGACSGLAFSPLMGIAALFAGIGVSYASAGSLHWAVFIGPNVVMSALVAAAWGVPGGALGAMASRRLRGRRSEELLVGVVDDEQDPPD